MAALNYQWFNSSVFQSTKCSNWPLGASGSQRQHQAVWKVTLGYSRQQLARYPVKSKDLHCTWA